jgi:hypothetical protein
MNTKPFSREMAQEWIRSNTFKTNLLDLLNKSLCEWRKENGVKEKTILQYTNLDKTNQEKRKVKPISKKT